MTAAIYSPFSSSIHTRIEVEGTKISPKSIVSPLFSTVSPQAANVNTDAKAINNNIIFS